MSGLVELARYGNSLDAGVARSRLEAEGLHCVLFDQGFSSVEAVGLFIPVRLMVLDEDLKEARALLGVGEPTGPTCTTLRGWAVLVLITALLSQLPLWFLLARLD